MQRKELSLEQYGEIFPHVEKILHSGLCTFSFTTQELHLSKGVYYILGIPDSSVATTDDSILKFVDEEDKAQIFLAVAKIKERKKFLPFEFSITDSKGLKKRLYAECEITSDKEGADSECYCIIKDITESYFYKMALEQKIQQLDKSNKNLQEFVYVASHDLQEPLRKIYTFTERLSNKFQVALGQEGDMYVKRILSSTKNLQTLLEDLLNFSRLSFNPKQVEVISIKKCVDEIISDLEIKIEETKTTIICDKLPEIEAFPSQIKQLFSNLLTNAIKFRKAGQPPTINISCDMVIPSDFPDLSMVRGSKYVKIVIEDNGIGFDQEFSERIFQIFQRLNGKSEYVGSGVGLAICKKIVENHHGFIFANGSPEGAKFTILLPQKQP
jgi:hypothetical protein